MFNKLAYTNEILGVISLNGMNSANIAELREDPHSFLMSYADAEVPGDTSINFVDNSSDVINLTLPYYSSVDSLSGKVMSDDDLDNVSGGEIFVSIIIGVAAGAAIVTAAGLAIGARVQQDRGNHIDGTPIRDEKGRRIRK